MTDAVGEGSCLPGDDEHPRRPVVCPPFTVPRSLGEARNPARDWLRPAAWLDVVRFLLSRDYRPRS